MNCLSGFHGSLRESLTSDKCKICNRNYEEEDFKKACKELNINRDIVLNSSHQDFMEFINGRI